MTYITVSAVDAGVGVGFSYDLVAIVNAVSALGLVTGGLLADRYGALVRLLVIVVYRVVLKTISLFADPLTVLTSSSLLLAAVTYAWPFANNIATFAVVAVLAGCVAVFAPDQCFFGLTLTVVSLFPWQKIGRAHV